MESIPASVRLFLLLIVLLLPAALVLLYFPVQMAAAWQVRWIVYAAHMVLILATPLLTLRGLLLAVTELGHRNRARTLALLGLVGHGLAQLLWLYAATSIWPILLLH